MNDRIRQLSERIKALEAELSARNLPKTAPTVDDGKPPVVIPVPIPAAQPLIAPIKCVVEDQPLTPFERAWKEHEQRAALYKREMERSASQEDDGDFEFRLMLWRAGRIDSPFSHR